MFSARATEILGFFMIWFPKRFRSWMVLFGSWLERFVSSIIRVNVLPIFEFDAVGFMNFPTAAFFDRWTLWIGTIHLPLIPRIQDWKFMLKFMMVLCWFWILKRIARVRLLCRFDGGPDSVLLLRFLLKIRSVRILDTIVCSGTFLWVFPPTWDAVRLTLKVGFMCPFVVIDPTNLGATIVVAQSWCLTTFNLSPTQNTCLFTNGNKASVCRWILSAWCWRRPVKFLSLLSVN